jgi:hypothetical protein
MGKRTVNSCWEQFEKLANMYLNDEVKSESAHIKLIDLTTRVNKDNIGDHLINLFIKPYYPQPVDLKFMSDCSDGISEYQTSFDTDTGTINVFPVSIVQLYQDVNAHEPPERDEADLLHCRHASFLAEMGKLSSIYFLFLLLLQRAAYLTEVAHLEKRGGVIEVAEGEAYHTMLWAFKELEVFVAKRLNGKNLRADFAISWFESDWITGR